MHGVRLRRAKHSSNRDSNPNLGTSNNRLGLPDLPLSLPSIPLNIFGIGPKNTPTPGNNNPAVALPPQQQPPQPTPTPDVVNGNGNGNGGNGNGNVSGNNNGDGNGNGNGNGGNGGDNTAPPGSGNTNTPNSNPNISPDSSTPTPNPDPPNPNSQNPSGPSPTGASSPSQSNGGPQNGPVQLFGPNSLSSDFNNPSGGSSGVENGAFTTISDVRTRVTNVPHSGDGVTNTGGGSTGGGRGEGGGGDGSGGGGNPSDDGGMSPGVIAAIVIGVILALALLVCFLRKRTKKRRATQRRRWLSRGEKGPRDTLRSSFGDLRASSLGHHSEDGHDNLDSNGYSGPFSDTMTAPFPGLLPPPSPTLQMTQVTYTDIAPLPAALHSIGRRSSRSSLFSIGSAGSYGTDSSDGQWSRICPDVRWSENGESDPTGQSPLPSPTSIRTSVPSRSWSFPKPPTSRAASLARNDESKGFLNLDPFADPVSQQPPAGFSLVEMVTTAFQPKAADELAVEVGDVVTVLNVFDDGWGKVKVLRRNGITEGVEALEGLVPMDCLSPRGNEGPLFVDTSSLYSQQVNG